MITSERLQEVVMPGHDAVDALVLKLSVRVRQVAPCRAAAFLHRGTGFGRLRRDATKCMFGVESLLPRNDTAITHFSALKRQGELFH